MSRYCPGYLFYSYPFGACVWGKCPKFPFWPAKVVFTNKEGAYLDFYNFNQSAPIFLKYDQIKPFVNGNDVQCK